ncbi:MAG: hypothetical protein GY870_04210 [archaeon]|nr:hypothetical protein [archaeon]
MAKVFYADKNPFIKETKEELDNFVEQNNNSNDNITPKKKKTPVGEVL